MPIGMILWEWDTRSGANTLGLWPKNIEFTNKTLMQLYSQHLYSAKADVVSMYIGSLNILSLWTGSIHNYFLTLILKQDEDAESYTDIITDIMYYLIPYIEQDTYKEILPFMYQRFEEYTDTSEEQRRAIIYSNELNRSIITFLQEEGIYYKEELKIWLNDHLNKSTFNFDLAIDRLSQNDYIKIASVKNVEGTYLFLLNDSVIMRAPPIDIYQKNDMVKEKSMKEQIVENIREYFTYYQPNERDNLQIVDFMCQTDYYKVINYLRKTHMNTDTLSKITLHQNSDIHKIITDLVNNDIINSIKTKNGEEIYYLKTDIIIDNILPKFMMKNIYHMTRDNKKNKALIHEYIKILKESYLHEKNAQKAK